MHLFRPKNKTKKQTMFSLLLVMETSKDTLYYHQVSRRSMVQYHCCFILHTGGWMAENCVVIFLPPYMDATDLSTAAFSLLKAFI